jgi:hypothetical protein
MRAPLPSGGDGVIVQGKGTGGGGGGGGVGPGLGGGVGGFTHFPAAVQTQCAAVHVTLFVFVEHGCGVLQLWSMHEDPGAAAQAAPQHMAHVLWYDVQHRLDGEIAQGPGPDGHAPAPDMLVKADCC